MRTVISRATRLLAFLVIAHASGLGAQEDLPPVFERLAGSWVGSGVLLERPAAFEMRWELGENGFVHLTFTNAFVGEDGARMPVLSSRATYLPRGSTAVGVWLDTRPQQLTLLATMTDSSVVTNWTAEAEEGRTEYVVRSDQEVVVRDFVLVGGVERPFASATYRRAPPPEREP